MTSRSENSRAWVLVAPYVLLLAALMLVPFVATVHKALSTAPTLTFTLLSSPAKALAEPLSARNFRAIAADPDSRKVIGTTVLLAASVATLLCGAAMFVGYYIARGRRWAGTVNAIVTFPSLAPGVAIAFGVLWLFGPTGPINSLLWRTLGIIDEPISFTGTLFAVIVGDMVLFSTIAVRMLASIYEMIDPVLEQASESLGARDSQTFRYVVWPLLLPGLAAAWIFLFFRTMAAYVAALVLGGGTRGVVVIPLEIYLQINSLGVGGTIGTAAALAVVLVGTTLVGRALFLLIMRRAFRERLGTEVL